MNAEELALISQLLDSSELVLKELEKAFNNKDILAFKTAKEEILILQKQLSQLLKNGA